MNERRRTDGPLSELQTQIMDRLTAGERQRDIAKELEKSQSHVSGEAGLCALKLKARTTAQACGFWSTARAYREAADLLEDSVQDEDYGGDPDIPKVNAVLFGLAAVLRERADRLIPS